MKKISILVAAFVLVSTPAFAQYKQVAKAVKGPALKLPSLPRAAVQPVGRISFSETAKRFARSLSRGKIPSVKVIKTNYLKEANLLRPSRAEFFEQYSKHGVVVRKVNLPGTGIDRAFTDNGTDWLYSREALDAIDDGFQVHVQHDGSINFSVDGQAPFFDFYDPLVFEQVKELKQLGFVLETDGGYFKVHFPNTSVSETSIFLDEEVSKAPMLLKDAPSSAFVVRSRLSLHIPIHSEIPDLYVGRWAEVKPDNLSMLDWGNYSTAHMEDVISAYKSLELIVKDLGPAVGAVDIVWRGHWVLRDSRGNEYRKVAEFLDHNDQIGELLERGSSN